MPAPVNRRPPAPQAGTNSGSLALSASGRRQHWSEAIGVGRTHSTEIPPIPLRIEGAAEITARRVAKIVGARKLSAHLVEAAAALEKHRLEGAINTPLRAAHFVAQCAHESMGFSRRVENLNYKPAAAVETFRALKSVEEATGLLDADTTGEALANHVYSSHTRVGKQLGNTQDGDGYRFRGRGYIQLTGRSNYAAAGKALKIDLVQDPDRAAEVDMAARTAVWFWKRVSINVMADLDDVVAVTRLINPTLKGLGDRRTKTELALTAFGLRV